MNPQSSRYKQDALTELRHRPLKGGVKKLDPVGLEPTISRLLAGRVNQLRYESTSAVGEVVFISKFLSGLFDCGFQLTSTTTLK